MTLTRPALRGHTGLTSGGNVRFVKIGRLGKVTIYKRGEIFYLYYRENNRTIRWPVDGNLATARATASKTNGQLEEGQRSMFSYQKVTPEKFMEEFLGYVRDVQKLAWRTVERYRAALERFGDFANSTGRITTIDRVDDATIQDFIRWLRGQLRARNGADGGRKDCYRSSGIRFILSTCRTAFNWARKRRYLPPYSENPFGAFPIKTLRDRDEAERSALMLSSKELPQFFNSCDDWQLPIFTVLATYGLRVAELTHLLIEDVDLESKTFRVRSKPVLRWHVKTSLERVLPLFGEAEDSFRRLIGERKAGFVFLDRSFVTGAEKIQHKLITSTDLAKLFAEEEKRARESGAATEKDFAKHMEHVAQRLGKISEKQLRVDFMTVTKQIGRPDVTKVHSLRHLFTTQAQEAGVNPLVVQQILGHTTLDMTRRYTHLGVDAQREALRVVAGGTDDKTQKPR